MTRLLRNLRNRFLRLHLLTTSDRHRAETSPWTWGAYDSAATEWWVSPLSLLHDLAERLGYEVMLELPDDAHTVGPLDPRWNTEATLRWRRR